MKRRIWWASTWIGDQVSERRQQRPAKFDDWLWKGRRLANNAIPLLLMLTSIVSMTTADDAAAVWISILNLNFNFFILPTANSSVSRHLFCSRFPILSKHKCFSIIRWIIKQGQILPVRINSVDAALLASHFLIELFSLVTPDVYVWSEREKREEKESRHEWVKQSIGANRCARQWAPLSLSMTPIAFTRLPTRRDSLIYSYTLSSPWKVSPRQQPFSTSDHTCVYLPFPTPFSTLYWWHFRLT